MTDLVVTAQKPNQHAGLFGISVRIIWLSWYQPCSLSEHILLVLLVLVSAQVNWERKQGRELRARHAINITPNGAESIYAIYYACPQSTPSHGHAAPHVVLYHHHNLRPMQPRPWRLHQQLLQCNSEVQPQEQLRAKHASSIQRAS